MSFSSNLQSIPELPQTDRSSEKLEKRHSLKLHKAAFQQQIKEHRESVKSDPLPNLNEDFYESNQRVCRSRLFSFFDLFSVFERARTSETNTTPHTRRSSSGR